MTSIPLCSCEFEKICIRFSLRFLKKIESTLVGSCLLKGDTWPAETRVLSRGRKREDPGNEVVRSEVITSEMGLVCINSQISLSTTWIELLTFSQWFYVTVIRFVRFLLELSLTIDVNKLFFPLVKHSFLFLVIHFVHLEIRLLFVVVALTFKGQWQANAQCYNNIKREQEAQSPCQMNTFYFDCQIRPVSQEEMTIFLWMNFCENLN